MLYRVLLIHKIFEEKKENVIYHYVDDKKKKKNTFEGYKI
jgi:hypothetical protein